MRSKIMGMATAMSLLLMLSISNIHAEPVNNLTDVSDHWAGDTVNKWVNMGLVSGYPDGRFYPDKTISRAEFVTLVNRIFNFVDLSDATMTDVSQDSWYKNAILKAVAAGLVQGYGDGTFRPEDPISRQEAVAILFRAYELSNANESSTIGFNDAEDISDWARAAVTALFESGYIHGRIGNIFEPKAEITRAETIALLNNLTKGLISDKGSYTGTKEGNLVVNTKGVILKDMVIEGNLYLTQGIDEGDITLENVIVKGKTFIKGGETGVILINTTLEDSLIINKKDGNVKVIAQGTTSVQNVIAESGVRLEDETKNNKGFINVHIADKLRAEQAIILTGDFNTVSIGDAGANLQISGGIINVLNIGPNASVSNIIIAPTGSVSDLKVWSAAKISGYGMIGKAYINAPGVIIEQRPASIELSSGLSATIGGAIVTGSVPSGTDDNNYNEPVPGIITGIGSAATVLQLGEITQRTASTTETGIITWSSSNPNTATINSTTGLITAVGAGNTNISYRSSNGITNSIPVTVYDYACVKNPVIGPVQVLEANVTPAGISVPAAGQSIKWESNDISKATIVSSTGMIHAITEGDVTISYVITENSTGRIVEKGSLNITVLPAKPGLGISGVGTKESILQLGEIISRTAVSSQTGVKTWSSSNTNTAVIDASTGVVTAISEGKTNITYISSDGRTNSVEITVYGPATVKNPVAGEIRVNEPDKAPTDFILPSIDQDILWQSSDPGKATVNALTGLIHAVETGNTIISYNITETSTGRIIAKGSMLVEVQPLIPSPPIIGIGTADTVFQIGEITSRIAVTSQGGTKTWSSSNINTAVIDPSTGVVTAINEGTTNISYTSSDGKSNSILITVFGPAVIKNPLIGTVQVLENDVTPADYVLPSDGQEIEWTSSDTNKAAVNAATGIIHAVSAGSTTISYKITEIETGRIAAKGSALIDVLAAKPALPITGIGTADTVLQIGETMVRTAVTNNAGIKTWSSSDRNVADIDVSTGVITAINQGTATISYSSSDGRNNSVIISVYGPADILNPVIGVVQVLEADVMPTGFNPPAAGQQIIWSSSDPGKAQINTETGVIHAVSAGSTTISYKTIEIMTGKIVEKGQVNVDVQLAAPGLPITGVGSADTVLQIGETMVRTAATTHAGTKTWISSDVHVAVIDPSTGIVTAMNAGATDISYISSDGRTNSRSVTVYEPAIIQNPAVGDVQVLENDVTPTDFIIPLAGQQIIWTSSDTSKAVIDSSTGLIHAVAAGQTTISYKITETTTGHIIAKGSVIVDVQPATPGLPIIDIGTAEYVLQMGETTNITASTLQSGVITWSSSDINVAAIDSNTGVITAINPGTSVISYISSDKRTNSILVTVYDFAAISNPVIDIVQIGEADVIPAGFISPAVGESILWASSDISRATADTATGAIHAVAAGNTTISYQVKETLTGRIVAKGATGITVHAPAPQMNLFTLEPGSDFNETRAAAAFYAGAVTYKYKLQPVACGTRPYIGMDEPTGFSPLILNMDMTASAGQHFVVIALDVSGKVIAMTDHLIQANEVVTTPIYIYISDYSINRIICSLSSGAPGSVIVPVVDNLPYSGPMAVTVSMGKVYWAQQDSMGIMRSNTDGTAQESVLITMTNNISAIAVDETNGRIYWADYNSNKISSAKLDGTDIRDIIPNADIPGFGPAALTISDQKLYWAGDTGNIECSDLDGFNRKTIVAAGAPMQSISSLAVYKGKIYWNDYRNNCIKSANMTDGSGLTTVISNADKGAGYTGVTAISIKNDTLYWSCDSNGEVRRARLNGSSEEIIYTPVGPAVINGLDVE